MLARLPEEAPEHRRKVRFALREQRMASPEGDRFELHFGGKVHQKRQRRPLGKRMQHGGRCIYLRWRRSSVVEMMVVGTKLVSSGSDPRPAVTLSNVASLLQVVETPRKCPHRVKGKGGELRLHWAHSHKTTLQADCS